MSPFAHQAASYRKKSITPRSCDASEVDLLNAKKGQMCILSAQLLEEKLFCQNLLST